MGLLLLAFLPANHSFRVLFVIFCYVFLHSKQMFTDLRSGEAASEANVTGGETKHVRENSWLCDSLFGDVSAGESCAGQFYPIKPASDHPAR